MTKPSRKPKSQAWLQSLQKGEAAHAARDRLARENEDLQEDLRRQRRRGAQLEELLAFERQRGAELLRRLQEAEARLARRAARRLARQASAQRALPPQEPRRDCKQLTSGGHRPHPLARINGRVV